MPGGKVHSIATIAVGAATGYAVMNAGYGQIHALAVTGGALAGLLLTPDLDVNGGSISNDHARKLGGWVFGYAWAILWTPYSQAIPHRSPLSHFPVLGTVLRLAYLALIAYIIAGLFHLIGRVPLPALPYWWPWAFAGLVMSDTTHFIMDKLFKN